MLPRFLGAVFYIALGLLLLTFIFSNRAVVTITLLPFLETITAPLYISLAAMFALGLLLGLLYAAVLSLGHGRCLRRTQRALDQAEKELAARSVTTLSK